MLVLARKTHQTIRIGDQITVSVVSVRGRTVRLGIEAPADVRVVRGELTILLDENTACEQNSAASDSEAPSETPAAPIPNEAFAPTPRVSTAYVNRVLSLRRRMKDQPAPARLAFS